MVLIEANDQTQLDMLECMVLQRKMAECRDRLKELHARLEAVLSHQDDADGLAVTQEDHTVMAFFYDRHVVVQATPRPIAPRNAAAA